MAINMEDESHLSYRHYPMRSIHTIYRGSFVEVQYLMIFDTSSKHLPSIISWI